MNSCKYDSIGYQIGESNTSVVLKKQAHIFNSLDVTVALTRYKNLIIASIVNHFLSSLVL